MKKTSSKLRYIASAFTLSASLIGLPVMAVEFQSHVVVMAQADIFAPVDPRAEEVRKAAEAAAKKAAEEAAKKAAEEAAKKAAEEAAKKVAPAPAPAPVLPPNLPDAAKPIMPPVLPGQPNSSAVLGKAVGAGKDLSYPDKSPIKEITINAGWGVDKIGLGSKGVGGAGGAKQTVSLTGVVKINVTSGEYCYGGNSIGSITLIYASGKSETIGKDRCYSNSKTETIDLKGKQIVGIKAWPTPGKEKESMIGGIQFETR